MWSKHQKIIAVCANLFCMINHQRCHGFSFHSKSFVTTPILNGHTNRQYIHSSTTHSFSKTHDNDSNTEATNNTDQEEQKSNDMFHQTDYRANIKEERRRFLSQMTSTGFLLTNTWMLQPKSVMAKTGQVKTSQYAGKTASTKAAANPKEAFQGLLKAREELQYANSKFIQKGDMEGLRSYLMNDATNISSFESYALSILASKLITDEDKKEIGTIRRYGVGADVMIMYGGLMAEMDEMNDEPDPAVASKFLGRTLDSLNEVIQICVNNGF